MAIYNRVDESYIAKQIEFALKNVSDIDLAALTDDYAELKT
jgi:hypothetical protein